MDLRPTQSDLHRTQAGFSLAGLCERVHSRIVESEVKGGLHLRKLSEGALVQIRTLNTLYCLELRSGRTWISGHPDLCPQPVAVVVHGSSWGGSMIKRSFLGRGMHMEFEHPRHQRVTTSRIVSIHQS